MRVRIGAGAVPSSLDVYPAGVALAIEGEYGMSTKSLMLGAALALCASLAAQAQELITAADPSGILNIARGYGSATLAEQSNGDPKITGKVNGITYQVYFRNCTDNKNCEDLNFYLGFLDVKPSMDTINTWNAEKRFSRAYLDVDKDAVVEWDLDLQVGVTAEYMDKTFELWTLVIDAFAKHVGYN